jgi:hypothetical protein
MLRIWLPPQYFDQAKPSKSFKLLEGYVDAPSVFFTKTYSPNNDIYKNLPLRSHIF